MSTTSIPSTEDSSSQQGEEEDDELMSTAGSQSSSENEDDLPLVRDHSYLPGTSHPLHIEQRSSINLDDRQPCSRTLPPTELAVLELPGVVLFPGSTFPLRFSQDSAWMEYLGRQIQASRAMPSQAHPIRLGILTEKPSATRRLSEQRRHWLRQGFGPTRLRRLSEQLIRELGDMDDLSSDSETEEASEEAVREQAAALEVHPREVAWIRTNTRDSANSSGSTAERRTGDRYGYIDRIGTIVTVINTHGDEARALASSQSNGTSSIVFRSLEEGGQLVITALATGRFRVVGYAGSEEEHELFRNRTMMHLVNVVRTFLVEEIDDSPIPLPPMKRPFASLSSSGTTQQSSPQQNQMVHCLSMVSPLPEFVYQNNWPWRLVSMIKESMAKSHTFATFLETFPSKDASDASSCNDTADPVQLSFWMASNLPFTQAEKLHLLEMHSTVERLRFIYHKVVEAERSEPLIHCKTCSVPLSRAVHMFTVGGAEGTTGAYVNEHGCVHQTITIRDLNQDGILYAGGPQTRDSWFPGYSWTIMSCAVCFSHLGWKFVKVGSPRASNRPAPKDRPDVFYGLSAGSVSVVVPTQRERETILED